MARMIGLDSNVLVRYFAQDDARQAAAATRLIEQTLSGDSPGFLSLPALVETIWVMQSCYNADRAVVARAVEGLLTAPQILVQQAEAVWRALRRFGESQADFSDLLIAELGAEAGCRHTATFDRQAARHPGFALLR